MIQEIVTDESKLSILCKEFHNKSYVEKVVQDLIDTANAHKDICLGLAANQIGHNARIFVMKTPKGYMTAINPKVVCKYGGRMQWFESCLSRPGKASIKVKRYKKIKIRLTKPDGDDVVFEFNGLSAKVVQHELDHLNGVLI